MIAQCRSFLPSQYAVGVGSPPLLQLNYDFASLKVLVDG